MKLILKSRWYKLGYELNHVLYCDFWHSYDLAVLLQSTEFCCDL